jgi:hypothetical protein
MKPTHRHLKSGNLYQVISHGVMKADLTPVVIYRNRSGQTWVRPRTEFNDGRFEELRAADRSWSDNYIPIGGAGNGA